MIKMVDKQTIICKHRADGVSQREIARQMGLSRSTVHKVVAEYEAALGGSDPDSALESVLTTPPKYAGGGGLSVVVLAGYVCSPQNIIVQLPAPIGTDCAGRDIPVGETFFSWRGNYAKK